MKFPRRVCYPRPVDFSWQPLGSLGDLFQGLPLRNEDADGDTTFRLFNIRDLETLEVHGTGGEHVSLNLSTAALGRHLLRANDVLITTRTRPIRAGVVTSTLENGIAGQNLAVLRPGPLIHPLYVAALFSTSYGKDLANPHFGKGSSIPLLSIGALRDMRIPVPPLNEQHGIANLALAHEREIQAFERELEQRRMVIEHVMRLSITGQIRFPEE